jgi:unconventional prefoldin RPB5 interactor 1
MAIQKRDTLDDLERQRLHLEENVRKLRQSLYNWRLWEAEYDGLRDELETLEDDCTSAEILQIGIELEGTVVDEKEVKALIGDKRGSITRSRDQVVLQISRRLDYVKQNVATIEKRLAAADSDLDRLLSVESPGPHAATEDYAVTEIFEELDENGEVVSSKLSTPADRAPEIMDALRKAGVMDDSDRKSESKAQDSAPSPVTTQLSTEQANTSKNTVITTAETNTAGSEDSDSEAPTSEVDESPEDAKLRREMLEYSFHEVGKVVAELEMDEGSDVSYDDDDDYDDDEYEDEEDEYGRTTSAVLTEEYHQQMKDLEERLKAGGFVNLGPAKNMPAETMRTAEAEAASAPASQAGVLRVTSIERKANKETPTSDGGDKKKPKKKVAFAEDLDIAPEKTATVTPPASSKPTLERKTDVVKPEVTPLSESIVERTTKASTSKDTTGPASKKKASRFKSARNDGTPTPGDSSTAAIGSSTAQQQQPKPNLKKSDQAPTTVSLFPARPSEPKPFSQPIIAGAVGDIFSAAAAATSSPRSEPAPPEGKISAETLVERPPAPDSNNVLPPDPDEIDDGIHRKEIASEFYRRRNLKVQQSGGFLQDDDDEQRQDELYELDENDQPKRKVSKFKAARIRP